VADDEQAQESTESASPPKSGKGKMIAIVVVVAVFVLGAVAGGFILGKGRPGAPGADPKTVDALEDEVEHGAATHEPSPTHEADGEGNGGGEAEPSNVLQYEMRPITVNLNEPQSTRRIVSVTLLVCATDEAARAKIQSLEYKLRHAIIVLTSSRTLADVRSEEGKELLLREIRARMDEILGRGVVEDLFYSDIVYQ
jgi:flagellar basal body-associated protein FliL